MIAEAATERQQQQQQERRCRAARQKTVEALWDDVAKRRREAWSALHQAHVPASATSAPAAATSPEPEPRAANDSPRPFVLRSVIGRGAPSVWVSKPGPTFADVLRTYDGPYRRRYGGEMTAQQDKVLREMLACYTPLLGTHAWTCRDCGTVVVLPNGCNNRHCCTCGSTKRWRWAEGICSQILPIEYAHVILTLPKQITQLAMINQSELYSLVLREGAYTVLEGGKRLFDIELGLLTLLHTWGQLLLAHVHSHCLLPLGGLRQNTLEWMNLSQNQLDQLLEYVRREFPKRFCKALRKAFQKEALQFDGDTELEHLASPAEFERWIEPLENMSWVVRCGESWDRTKMDHGPEATTKIVQYLANYVGRVALSDSRIVAIDGERVLFKYKDYRDGNQQKAEWIEGVELVHRFLQHLLPYRFRHIRRYGWMGPRIKPEKRDVLQQVHGPDDLESGEQVEDQQETPLDDDEPRTQTCRFCSGDMYLTRSTTRPRVFEIMEMPLSRFRQAQAAFKVTLGARLLQIEAQRGGDPSAPVITERYRQIRSQLVSMISSSYL